MFNHAHGTRFSLRGIFVVLTLLAIVFAGYGYMERKFYAPRRWSDSVEQRIRSLALRCPRELSPRQWESAVAWTLNLHGNSLLPFQANAEQIRQFDQRLQKKLAGKVDLTTTHWIWDEYAQLCPGGANYQRFRALMEEEIEAGGSNWNLQVPPSTE